MLVNESILRKVIRETLIEARFGKISSAGQTTTIDSTETDFENVELKDDSVDVNSLSEGTKNVIKAVAALVKEKEGKLPIVVTSGYRDATKQIDAMYNNWQKKQTEESGSGLTYLQGLYQSYSRALIKGIHRAFLSDPPDKKSAIDTVTKNPISRHQSKLAFDLRSTDGHEGLAILINDIKKIENVKSVVNEGDHIHIECKK